MAAKPRVNSPAVVEYAELHKIDLANVTASGANGAISVEDVKNARPMPYVTTLVAKVASENDVDLRDVAGTGIGGRIRKDDVLRAAGVLPTASHESAATSGDAQIDEILKMLRPADPGAAIDTRSRGAAFARNPLVDQVRAQASAAGAVPPSASSAPTLFASGDLPSFTASGIPPQALLDAPWQARHAMAAAPTTADAYAILNVSTDGPEVSGTPDNAYEYELHPGNVDYQARVQKWQADAVTPEQAEADWEASQFGQHIMDLERRNAARDAAWANRHNKPEGS